MTVLERNTAYAEPFDTNIWPSSPAIAPATNIKVRTSTSSRWVKVLLDRLETLSLLQANWGGVGSATPTIQSISACLEAVGKFMPDDGHPPSVLPTFEGGIQLEWHAGQWDVEVEFDPEGNLTFWGQELTSQKTIFGDPSNLIELARAIVSLTQKRLRPS